MPVYPRKLEAPLRRAARAFPAVVVTGPRRAGKTFCLRRTFPKADYRLLEEPDVLARVRADPRGFLDDLTLPAILDEIQNAPELLPYIRARIDAAGSRKGRWFLTGSQDFALMRGVSESMAGRAAVFELLPLSSTEVGSLDLLRGGYPEVRLRPRSASLWFRSYLMTYLERDVRAVTAVRDLGLFRRFLGLLATRNATLLNRTEFSAPLGISVPTVSEWLGVLETTGILLVVPPWYENLGKRLVKSPKIYFADTGLLCHLLGIESRAELLRSPLAGGIFEAAVAAELVKSQVHSGARRALYHFRDQQGLEVDFLLPRTAGRVLLVEAKYSRTVTPADARPIQSLLPRFAQGADGVVVHGSPHDEQAAASVLTPGVRVLTVQRLVDELHPSGGRKR